METLQSWLESLGLGKYAPAFAVHEVELGDLTELSEDDLREIGLPIGPRRRILKALRGGTAPREPLAARIDAERRQLTVMFVDMVGYTARSERLDPEDLAEVMRLFKESCAASVARYNGHVAQYLGDGILAYFGFPIAHEDDAERAIRAGLELIGNMPGIPTEENVQVRIGIATGLVVVGDLSGGGVEDHGAVMGETPNLAARLQSVAEPGSIIVAPSTRRVAGDVFAYEERGRFALKGFSEKVTAWRVLGPRQVESRFMATRPSSLTSMIGRADALGVLRRAWDRAEAGAGQLIMVSGAAGIGKSRLVEGLYQAMQGEPHVRINYQSSALHQSSALYPLIEQIERAAQIRIGDSDAEKLEKLSARLPEPTPEALQLLAELLAIETCEPPETLEPDPQKRRKMTEDMLVRQVVALARLQPVLLVFEDAHWVDPTTKALLDRIAAVVEGAAILMVVTARPQFDAGWDGLAHFSRLMLPPLDGPQVAALVREVGGGREMPVAISNLIASKTDGVPLYIEEVTKGLLESGLLSETDEGYRLIGPLPALAVPSTLQDSLMARLDRLGIGKSVAQTAAVLGRHFSLELIAKVSGLEPETLRIALRDLVEAEILSPGDNPQTSEFVWRHALIRDTAYGSLLRRERQNLHERVARTLIQINPQLADIEPETLAHHYSIAHCHADAVPYWKLAGQRALMRSAIAEAETHLTKALDELSLLPAGRDRDRREIEIQVLRSGVLRSTRGIAAEETGRSYARVRELCTTLGDSTQLFPVLNGLYAFHLVRAEYDRALKVAREMLQLAEQTGRVEYLMTSHRALGATMLHMGAPHRAIRHLRKALEHYDAEQHGHLALVYGTDHAAITASFLGMALCLSGEQEAAVTLQRDALDNARRLDHAHSIAQVLTYLCFTFLLQGRFDEARTYNAQLTELSDKHGFTFMKVTTELWKCWGATVTAPSRENTLALETAARAWWSVGAGNYKPFFLGLVAEGWLRLGELDEARDRLSEARQQQEYTNEGWSAAELLRIEAEVDLAQSGTGAIAAGEASLVTAAEATLRAALSAAHDSDAGLFEARIRARLVQLLEARGQTEAAQDLRDAPGVAGGKISDAGIRIH